MNRRELLQTSSLIPIGFGVTGMAGGALATCSSTGGIQIDPVVLDEITKAVAAGCNFVPAVTTIISIVSIAFPAVLGATSIAESVLKEISAMVCASAPTPAASGKFASKMLTAGGKDIPVNGWVINNGKLEYV